MNNILEAIKGIFGSPKKLTFSVIFVVSLIFVFYGILGNYFSNLILEKEEKQMVFNNSVVIINFEKGNSLTFTKEEWGKIENDQVKLKEFEDKYGKEKGRIGISKECSYNGLGCSNIPAGTTVNYAIKFLSTGLNLSNVFIVDDYKANTFASLKYVSSNGVNQNQSTFEKSKNVENRYIWWLGDVQNGKVATLNYTATLKQDLVNDSDAWNKATLYLEAKPQNDATASFKIKNPE